MCHSGFREKFLFRNITNTDGEELITDAHKISVQSAVMSGLEDVNSSQFFLGQSEQFPWTQLETILGTFPQSK